MPDFIYNRWDQATHIGVVNSLPPVRTFWLDMFFRNYLRSTSEYIEFDQLPASSRVAAPYVAPLNPGRGVAGKGANLRRVKPGYVKTLDPVTPNRAIRGPVNGSTVNGAINLTPQQRYNAIKTGIVSDHIESITLRWEVQAAEAILDGRVVMSGPDYPDTVVDFGRAADHSKSLSGVATWDSVDAGHFDALQDAIDEMLAADGGGATTDVVFGTQAWRWFRKGKQFKDAIDKNVAGSTIDNERGLVGGLVEGDARRVGTLGSGIDAHVYAGTYTDPNTGTKRPLMDPRDVVLVARGAVNGYRCFGTIIDAHAGFRALEIYGRDWLPDGDPSIEQILHQSAPLMVPTQPNATMRIRTGA